MDQSAATVNGKEVKLSVAPKLMSDTVIVPIRFVSEQMGLGVGWDNSSKTVYLNSPDSGSDSGSGSNAGSGTNNGNNNNGSNNNSNNNNGSDNNGGSGGSDSNVDNSNANLANVAGISFQNNQLMIAVDKNVTPSIFKMSAPDRIVVDLPNTKFANTFASNQTLDSTMNGYFDVTEYPEVSKVRYALFNNNPSTVRIVIDLNNASNYSLTQNSDGLIIVDLDGDSNSGFPINNGKKLVVLDAGHGGSDPGAISVTKKKEKDFNLAVALKVQALLKNEANIELVMTRESDTYPTLQDRAKLANSLNATIFISIHANSGSATASGVETYYSRSESIALANVMHKYLVESSGLSDRKVRSKSLHVTRETTMPAVLLECGYLSNKNDDALLYTEDFQNSVAQGIVKGIKEYLGE
ncbi:Sporulation-specific N-acetylmuramoyl-L-alanine amidase [compost metagenome]